MVQVAISTEDGPWTNMMFDDIDVESISMSMAVDNLGSQRKVAKTKRSGNYTHDEDIQLAISREKISTDPITANEQPVRSYWNRIADHFHANRTFESDRNACSLEHRWSTIQKECMEFQAYYEGVERRHPSGIPYRSRGCKLIYVLIITLHSPVLTLELCCRFLKHRLVCQASREKNSCFFIVG
jgi:hypothetical protein